jgi:vacuolar-type H+-ATPase subunit H
VREAGEAEATRVRADAEAAAAQAEERASHRLDEAEHGARTLREQVALEILAKERAADDELRRARAAGAGMVADARAEADELRAQARRTLDDARAEIALLARRRDGITAELGQLSGVIQALAVPHPHPSTAEEQEQ